MYFKVGFRTIILYFFIVICYRIMGKKEVGQLGIIDLIVSFSIAELASLSIENIDKSIFISILPITILVILEMLLSFISLKSASFRKTIDGNPEIIIKDGKINKSIMKKLRYTLDDLLTQLRGKNISSLENVKYATLETDGSLSITNNYPMPLITNGKIDNDTLNYINKDIDWLYDILKTYNVTLDNVFYAFYTNNKTYIIKNDELL